MGLTAKELVRLEALEERVSNLEGLGTVTRFEAELRDAPLPDARLHGDPPPSPEK